MLHIAKAQLEDSGPYMCQLNTDPMKSRMGILEVIIKPDIVDVSGPRAIAEGGNARYFNSLIVVFRCICTYKLGKVVKSKSKLLCQTLW